MKIDTDIAISTAIHNRDVALNCLREVLQINLELEEKIKKRDAYIKFLETNLKFPENN